MVESRAPDPRLVQLGRQAFIDQQRRRSTTRGMQGIVLQSQLLERAISVQARKRGGISREVLEQHLEKIGEFATAWNWIPPNHLSPERPILDAMASLEPNPTGIEGMDSAV